jgi:hypothetical protein
MNKQTYHKPEFRMYGNISVMTQQMGVDPQSRTDNPSGPLKTS